MFLREMPLTAPFAFCSDMTSGSIVVKSQWLSSLNAWLVDRSSLRPPAWSSSLLTSSHGPSRDAVFKRSKQFASRATAVPGYAESRSFPSMTVFGKGYPAAPT